MKAVRTVALLIIFASFLVGLFFYSQMPDVMASHWNAKGEVNGYMPKFWGLFLMPIISLALYCLLVYLPKLDPLKQNVDKFRGYYEGFVLIIFVFLLYIYGLTLAWNLGHRFSMGLVLVPAFAFIFYYAGVLIGKTKRNWFIGIKTPWTLSSDEVWDRTHRLGAILFKISGLFALIGLLFPVYAFWFILVPIIAFSVILLAYSYVVFKELEAKKKKAKKKR